MKNLSVILPVFNERNSIETVLKEWLQEIKKNNINFQFIVCEDGSTDGTSRLLNKIQSRYELLLKQDKIRRGYGKAVIEGIKAAKTDYILCVDSDGQCDPKDFMKLWNNKNQADVIVGWRTNRADPPQRKIFSFLFKSIFKFLFPTKIHDPSSPYVLCIRKPILQNLKYLKFLSEGFWWGFIGMCVKRNLSMFEIPINHRQRLKGNTVIYKINKIPSIAINNLVGLLKLKFN